MVARTPSKPMRSRRAPSSLAQYRAKRNFKSSPEPTGDRRTKSARKHKKGTGPIFCVQKHLASHLHYDFRLEHAGVLLSWAVPKGPSLNPKDKRLAMRVEDHPLDYAEFEGVIPEGYGAGIVLLWDHGTWQPEEGFEDVGRALEDGELKFRLDGVKLKGSWVLVRTRGPYGRGSTEGEASRSWLLIKHRDEWAGDVDVTDVAPQSVKSFGDFEDILAAENPSVWESHRPVEGGAAGRMLKEVIGRAAKLKAAREARVATRTGKQGKRNKTTTPRRRASSRS